MDRKILKNYLYNTLYQVVAILLPLITVPFINEVLTNNVLSIEAVVSNRIHWFRMFGMLGIQNYGNRQIARVRDNKEQLSKTFFEIYLMQFLLLTMSIACYVLFLQGVNEYHLISYLQILTLLSNMIDITWFFYGIENFKQAALRNIAIKLVGVILIFTFIRAPSDLPLYMLINGVTAVLGQLIMWVQMRKYLVKTKIKFKNVLQHIKPNIMFFIPQMAIDIYNLLPISMMDMLGKREETNFFRNAKQLTTMFVMLITSTGQVLLSRVSNMHAKKEDGKVQEMLQTITQFSLLIAIPMMFGIAAIMPMFVPWYFPIASDIAYLSIVKMVWILVPTLLFITISNVYGIQYLMPLGRMKQYIFSVSMAALAYLIVGFLLIPSLGMYGAAIGVLSAEIAVVFSQWIFVRKELKLFEDKMEILRFVLAALAMTVIVLLIGNVMGLKTSKVAALGVNALQAVSGICVYFVSLYLMKSKTLGRLVNRTRS